ncbi:nucleotidyltransferase domain-containing protein [Solicola sp. PLA-1-18]|uniref:nucleotidyltransferase domain-containing protein n=1 Tax=Solicola sp. PLA-1-18 TaxID=3380532 RepID=UPI003B7EB00E
MDEDAEFDRLFGPWDPPSIAGVAELLDGYQGQWWVVGGHAIEAFTGVRREHHDVDVAVWRRDLPLLRGHLSPRFDLWSVGSRTLRPLDDVHPDLHPESSQVWVREHALAPWLLDLLAEQDADGHWVFRRDASVTRPVEEVTWVGPDGLRYQRPEVVLAHKAAHARPQDDADLAAALPLLDDLARTWLADTLAHLHPGHRWLPDVAGGG